MARGGRALFSPVVDGRKTCSRCRIEKSVEDFYARARGGHAAACRSCWAAHRRAKLSADPLMDFKRGLWSGYRMRIEDYEALLEAQGGRCAICRSDGSDMERRFHVDHDHTCCPRTWGTCGKCIRGLLCHRCNLMLGNSRDSIETLKSAIDYLGGGE